VSPVRLRHLRAGLRRAWRWVEPLVDVALDPVGAALEAPRRTWLAAARRPGLRRRVHLDADGNVLRLEAGTVPGDKEPPGTSAGVSG